MITGAERLRPRSPVLVAEYPPASTFGPRRLRDHEFVWLLEGSATWVVERSGTRHEVALRPGRLALARPGDLDHYAWDGTRTSTHAYVHFAFEDDLDGDPWPLVRDLDGHPLLGGLCSYLLDLAASTAPSAEPRSTQVLALLLEKADRGSELTRTLFEKVVKVGCRLERRLTVARLGVGSRELAHRRGPLAFGGNALANRRFRRRHHRQRVGTHNCTSLVFSEAYRGNIYHLRKAR